MKRAVIALLIIAGAGAGAWVYYVRRAAPEIGALTSPITRGDIVDAVSTTGTLQAVHDGADRQSGVGEHLVPGR